MKYIRSYPNIAAYRADENADDLLVVHIQNNLNDFVDTKTTKTIYKNYIDNYWNSVDLMISLNDETWEDIGMSQSLYDSFMYMNIFINGELILYEQKSKEDDRITIYAADALLIYINDDGTVSARDNRPK